MFNPFVFSLMVFNLQMEMAQRMMFGFQARPRAQLNLVSVNAWRLPQRSRAVLALVR